MLTSRNILKPAIIMLAVVFAFGFTSSALGALKVDFKQSANKDGGYLPGDIHWIGSILQQQNSVYYEGMSTLQRIVFVEIPKTQGHVHTLTLSHEATKGGIHAYDFLTSWPQGVQAGGEIGGPTMFVNVNECGPEIGPPANLGAICAALHASGFTATPSAPDAMGTVGGDNVATRVAAYEAHLGDRTIKLYGNTAISAASIAFDGYTGSTDNQYANYTLTWTSSSDSIVIEMAGHLAAGTDPVLQPGVGYGAGRGSSSVSGGPYHFKLSYLDGSSLGSQDNQIKGADILLPPPVCDVTPASAEVCVGGSATFTDNTAGGTPPYTYCWQLNSAGPCLSTTATLTISNATLANAGTYRVIVTDAADLADTCYATLVVNSPPVLSATGDELTCDSLNASTDLSSTPSTGITIVWSGTGLVSGGNTLHARWSQPGFKKAVVTINATGCKDSTTAVITQDITKPVLSATGDELTCDSLLASACVSSTPNVGVSYLWTPAPVSGQGNACVRYDAPGTKKVVVTILATGCKDSTTAEITQNVTKPILSCTTDTLTCDSTNASTTVTSDPSVGIAIVWSGDGLVSGGNTTHARWSEPGVKKALVTIDATGCKDSCTAEVFPDTAKPTCTVSPTDTTICQGTNATFCINPSGGKPPYIYLWEGPNGYTSAESCITVSDSGTYTVTVKGTNGCADTCLAILRVETCGQEYCGLTQGAYGNYNGEHFGKRTLALIQSLLADSALVVGKPGRSITIDSAAAECIIKRLPGGTKPDTLPAIGDDTLSWDRCQTSPPIPLMLNGNDPGRFANVLLAQTITLSLNLRVSTCDLGSFELCDEIQTKKAVFGDDGLPCTDDDMIKPGSDSISVKIPSSVSTALSNLGLSNDVNGLLELANRALAGWPRGGASLSQINNAVDAINRGFDECRFVTYCGPLVPVLSLYKEAVSMPTEFSLSQSYPNPFNPVCVIAYALPTDCQVRLVVYNLLGQRVKVLVDELQNAGYKSVTWDGKDGQGQELASGIYFYRIEAGSFVQSKKMMLMK